jgi:hypothetical protein
MNMKRTILFAALALALPLFAQSGRRADVKDSFASDFQTIPVMGNTIGVGGAVFQTSVSILNPTASSIPVTVSLYDAGGTKRDAVITLLAGEMKTYANFLDAVFQFSGGGAVVFKTPSSSNRVIVNAEVKTAGARYGTSVPTLEFAGSNSRSFAPGVSVDSNTRTNIGCFNQSDATNSVKATILDNSGKQTIGTLTMTLPPNAWFQTAVTSVVSGGYIQFDPTEAAVCYAVVVDNSTNDGHFVSAAEYKP